MKTIITFISVICMVLIGCGEQQAHDASIVQAKARSGELTPLELSHLISSIHPWSSSQKYSSNDWDRIMEIAAVFQSQNTNVIMNALEIFQKNNTNNFRGDYLEDSKPFLLLRVMFDLPEHSKNGHPGGAGWLSQKMSQKTDLNSDETINIGWPISWKGSRPSLVTEYLGYEGPEYSPKADYMALTKEFKKRDLSIITIQKNNTSPIK